MAWRWTDANYAVLPKVILAQIRPIETRDASSLFEKSERFLDGYNLSNKTFQSIIRFRADVSIEVGRSWLRKQVADLDTTVFISWSPDMAVETSWTIFTEFWDDFCYPGSDDVLIWPDSERWALFYFHEEEFQFGNRCSRTEAQKTV